MRHKNAAPTDLRSADAAFWCSYGHLRVAVAALGADNMGKKVFWLNVGAVASTLIVQESGLSVGMGVPSAWRGSTTKRYVPGARLGGADTAKVHVPLCPVAALTCVSVAGCWVERQEGLAKGDT